MTSDGGIESFLHEKIPLTRAMGLRVERSDAACFVVSAPLSLNHNHMGTAFGGSLSAIATVAGYGYLWQQMGDRNCHIVIKEGAIRYRRPLRAQIRATCASPGTEPVDRFMIKYRRTGRAGIELKVTILDEGEIAAEFTGVFVAIKTPS